MPCLLFPTTLPPPDTSLGIGLSETCGQCGPRFGGFSDLHSHTMTVLGVETNDDRRIAVFVDIRDEDVALTWHDGLFYKTTATPIHAQKVLVPFVDNHVNFTGMSDFIRMSTTLRKTLPMRTTPTCSCHTTRTHDDIVSACASCPTWFVFRMGSLALSTEFRNAHGQGKIDFTSALHQLFDGDFDALVGELQLSFLLFVMVGHVEAFEAWRQLHMFLSDSTDLMRCVSESNLRILRERLAIQWRFMAREENAESFADLECMHGICEKLILHFPRANEVLGDSFRRIFTTLGGIAEEDEPTLVQTSEENSPSFSAMTTTTPATPATITRMEWML